MGLRLFGRDRLRHLHRVSPAKARSNAEANRPSGPPALGETLALVAIGGAVAVLALGLGASLSLQGWAALALLAALAGAGWMRWLLDFRSEVLASPSRVAGALLAVLAPLVGVAAWELGGAAVDLRLLPLPAVALVVSLMAGRALAVETTLASAAWLLAYLVLHGRSDAANLGPLAIALGGALAAALVTSRVRRRATLIKVGTFVGAVQASTALAFGMLGELAFGMDQFWELAQLVLLGVGTGLLVSGLLPAVEALFDVTTDISLLELGNTHESPLLRKLLLEASGTFHHSYIVGLLAEAAAREIGANALLARVGALYHDVGKLNKPEYFAENSPAARDRHARLTPEMSMLILSAHTRDGVELGRYYGLPQALLDFMVEHHGTTCLEYFHHRAVELRGAENTREEDFRYGGPKPQTRESAIVMVADASEAISRQMRDPSRGRLEEMVHRVATKRLMDGQFDECGLTLADLHRIEQACVRVLAAIYHSRTTFRGTQPHPLDLSQSAAATGADGVSQATLA